MKQYTCVLIGCVCVCVRLCVCVCVCASLSSDLLSISAFGPRSTASRVESVANFIFLQHLGRTHCRVIYICSYEWRQWGEKGWNRNSVPALAYFYKKNTKRTAKFNVSIRRSNCYSSSYTFTTNSLLRALIFNPVYFGVKTIDWFCSSIPLNYSPRKYINI